MKNFVDKDFILGNDISRKLYHEYCENLPIIDYHCHINPEEIYMDRHFDNITQLWLEGDHYKWRAMRSFGVDEKYITGDASDYDKFIKYAETLENAIGNPLYHWSHLELKKYFGYDGILNSKTADKVWEICKDKLINDNLSVRSIIEKSNVEVICTTDDPTDDLRWHKRLKECNFSTKVFPAWRPDKVINIEKDDYLPYIGKLENVTGINIVSINLLKAALIDRLNYFKNAGCKVSDHGIDFVPYKRCSAIELETIFEKALNKEALSEDDVEKYKTEMIIFLAAQYVKNDWVMQIHYGCDRNNNRLQYDILGPDTGYDSISNNAPSWKIVRMLDCILVNSGLPKTILYSLNPNDNTVIDSIIGSFQGSEAAGKIQHGSAWWFNDNKSGMEAQLISLANLGVLGKFVGMVTDSRSILSYTRHDYFRRILCNLIGSWVENGEYPEDYDALGQIVKCIAYDNAKEYFNL